jgi:hypothetical protein
MFCRGFWGTCSQRGISCTCVVCYSTTQWRGAWCWCRMMISGTGTFHVVLCCILLCFGGAYCLHPQGWNARGSSETGTRYLSTYWATQSLQKGTLWKPQTLPTELAQCFVCLFLNEWNPSHKISILVSVFWMNSLLEVLYAYHERHLSPDLVTWGI